MRTMTEENWGGALLRRAILLLAVVAVVAAMLAASAMPAFAEGKSTNLYLCTNDHGNFIPDVTQSEKHELQALGFRCRKQ